MATDASICNMAIGHVGGNGSISNLETDTSAEAKVCRKYYDQALKFVLSDSDWGFARTRVFLGELNQTLPENFEYEWNYVYTYPNDCLKAREIFIPQRRVDRTLIPFENGVSYDKTKKVIFTDQYQAQLIYTRDVTDPSFFSESFVMALSYYIAYLIAYSITKKRSVRIDMLNQYRSSEKEAEVSETEEEQPDELPEAEFMAGRN